MQADVIVVGLGAVGSAAGLLAGWLPPPPLPPLLLVYVKALVRDTAPLGAVTATATAASAAASGPEPDSSYAASNNAF